VLVVAGTREARNTSTCAHHHEGAQALRPGVARKEKRAAASELMGCQGTRGRVARARPLLQEHGRADETKKVA